MSTPETVTCIIPACVTFAILLDAPIVSFRGREDLQVHIQPTQMTHTMDISIHFRTSKEDGVIFTTWNGHNNDYMKAYLEGGQVHLDTFIERSSGQVYNLHGFAVLVVLTPCGLRGCKI